MRKFLAMIQGESITQLDDDSFSFKTGLTVDGDGCPRCYGPNDTGLDYTIDAGHPGNWFGVLTDATGNPVVQGGDDPAPGFYISTTSLQFKQYAVTDPRRYLNAEFVPYAVCPGILAQKSVGAVLGCKVIVVNMATNITVEAVCGDIGPSNHIGEGSIKLAEMLGFSGSPRDGGTSEAIISYTFYPGTAASGYSLQPL